MTTTRLRALSIFLGSAVAVPLVAAAVLSLGTVERAEHLDEVPVAIVNDDEIITGDRPMAAGRALSDALVHPDDEGMALGWSVTDADTAAEGLEDGTYYAVLTIPSDFSSAVLSVGADDPVATELLLETNPAASATAALASRAVSEAAADALGREVTAAFVSSTLTGVEGVSGALEDSADGAARLADGAASVGDGAHRLDEGAGRLAAGSDQVRAGAAQVADGAEELSAGADTLAAGAGEIANGAATAASGSGQVGDGAVELAAGAEALADAMTTLAASCPATGAVPAYCASVADASASARALASSADQVAIGAVAAASGVDTLSASSGEYAAGARTYADAAASLASGASRVATGASDTATGAQELAQGATGLTSGADEVAEGSRELADGLAEGADSVPSYSDEEIDRLAEVVAEPVTVVSSASTSGAGLLPGVIAAVVLWFAAVVSVVTDRRRRVLAIADATASAARSGWTVLRGRVVVATAQAFTVTAVLALCGFELGSIPAFAAAAGVAAICFTLLLTGLQSVFGRASVFAVAALTLLSLATLSVVLPLQTAPSWLAALEPFLPLSAVASLAGHVSAGAGAFAASAPLTCLLVWAALGVLLTIAGIGIRRGRPVTSRGFGGMRAMRGRMAA